MVGENRKGIETKDCVGGNGRPVEFKVNMNRVGERKKTKGVNKKAPDHAMDGMTKIKKRERHPQEKKRRTCKNKRENGGRISSPVRTITRRER